MNIPKDLSVTDIVKLLLGTTFAGSGVAANINIASVATNMEEVQVEMKETRKEIAALNGTLIRVVTKQEAYEKRQDRTEKRVDDNDSRIRTLEQTKIR